MERPNVRDAITRIRDLPTLPAVLAQIIATASDPEASALDLGKYIAVDQSLSATLLKIVNSAYYGFFRQINSVAQAIVILGFVEVRNMALAATAFQTLQDPGADHDRTQLWRHSLATAMATERCAKLLGLAPEECFVSGLLHDIGKVALDKLYPKHFREAIRRARRDKKLLRETEMEVFGLDHAGAGGALAEHWNLPEPIVDAIRCHHAPEASDTDPQLAQLTAVGDFITYQGSLGESSNGRPPPVPETSMAALRMAEAQWAHLAQDIQLSKGRIDELLGTFRR